MKNKNYKLDALIIGFALFAMFFGAGNLIFPPELGAKSGQEWFTSFFGFFLSDAGLSILGILAFLYAGGSLNKITKPVGDTAGKLLIFTIILCIGPLIAIPRTSAVTFSLGFAPITNVDVNNPIYLMLFSIVYFVVVYFLSIKPSKVVDIVGKFLTPILVASVAILLIKGFVSPIGVATSAKIDHVFKHGILSGYQTMDAMGSILYAGIVVAAIYGKGYKKGRETKIITIISSLIAGILLFVVYGGLAYLGATSGSLWANELMAGNMDQATFLIQIVEGLMGYAGVLVIGVVVLTACLTTAIGLSTTAGKFFSENSNGKIKYEHVILVVCIISALLSNLGLDTIINVAGPILAWVYPVVMSLIFMAFIQSRIDNIFAFRFSVIVTFIVSTLSVLHDLFKIEAFAFVNQLPLYSFGFNWVVPAVLSFCIGLLRFRKYIIPFYIKR